MDRGVYLFHLLRVGAVQAPTRDSEKAVDGGEDQATKVDEKPVE